MEVILLTNIQGIGAEGDRVTVSGGYARNYLLPRGMVSLPLAASAKRMEALKKIRVQREALERKDAEEMAKRMKSVVCNVTMSSAQEGKVFGGVTVSHLMELLEKQGFRVDRKQIKLENPIRSPGDFLIPIHLFTEVVAEIKVVVSAPVVERREEERPRRASGKKSKLEETEPPAKVSAEKEKPEPKREKRSSKADKKSS
jgi:large subunit ribosomal protein L9